MYCTKKGNGKNFSPDRNRFYWFKSHPNPGVSKFGRRIGVADAISPATRAAGVASGRDGWLIALIFAPLHRENCRDSRLYLCGRGKWETDEDRLKDARAGFSPDYIRIPEGRLIVLTASGEDLQKVQRIQFFITFQPKLLTINFVSATSARIWKWQPNVRGLIPDLI